MGQNSKDNQGAAQQLASPLDLKPLGNRVLILFIAIALIAGGLTATVVLNLLNGIWEDFYVLFGVGLVANVLFALIAYRVFSRSCEQSFFERSLVSAMNVVGLIGGVWLFLTWNE